ncbi:hypothetical protein ACFT6Z_36080 [Streptomyces sp. NPDC057131]|uniref:hypothetical protein n=1 Tax=Streptomyces sp. NPDC057131 TaxID=3346027 RepID=UPI0036334409
MLINKAKQLYADCDNADPNITILMPFRLPEFKDRNVFYTMFLGQLIHKYAIEQTVNDEWVKFNRESFYVNKNDKEGWKSLKSTCYRLEKKGLIETKFENGSNFVRLNKSNDEIFNPELYKRPE